MRRILGVCFLAVIFAMEAGCATKKPMTQEEITAERERQLNMMSRTYDNVTPEEVLVAADRVFRLADDDYNISHAPGGLQAQRNWMIYLILSVATGTDNWTVTVESLPDNKVKVIAMHSPTANSIFAGPAGGGVTSVTIPGMQNLTTRPAIYELFFSRLNYFLGKTKTWVTCKEASKIFTDGNLDPFCTVANDRTPDGKSRAERRDMEEKNN